MITLLNLFASRINCTYQIFVETFTSTLLQDKLEFGDLELNPETMRVKRDGDDIHLEAREFKLLSLLIERPERVFSRDQLLDLIWGNGVYVEDRTVDVPYEPVVALEQEISGPDGWILYTIAMLWLLLTECCKFKCFSCHRHNGVAN